MPTPGPIFRADRNQLFAVMAMLAAIFAFATGEITVGFVLFGVAAVCSIGGLFWNAHSADQADRAEVAARAGAGGNADNKSSKD